MRLRGSSRYPLFPSYEVLKSTSALGLIQPKIHYRSSPTAPIYIPQLHRDAWSSELSPVIHAGHNIVNRQRRMNSAFYV